MIIAHTLNDSGRYDLTESPEGAGKLSVQALTARKDQSMVYVTLKSVSGTAKAKLTFDMIDPVINGGKPFRMCRLEGSAVVPVELDIVAPGAYRVPVPTGANESRVVVNAELIDADAADVLEFWVTTNSQQVVSGMLS